MDFQIIFEHTEAECDLETLWKWLPLQTITMQVMKSLNLILQNKTEFFWYYSLSYMKR